MGQEKTEKKEIVEIKDDKAKATPGDVKTIELSKTYKFEGEEISSLRFTRLRMEDVTAENMIRANNIMMHEGTAVVVPENTLHFALIIASDTTGLPVEFFKQLKPKDAMAVRQFISNYFFKRIEAQGCMEATEAVHGIERPGRSELRVP